MREKKGEKRKSGLKGSGKKLRNKEGGGIFRHLIEKKNGNGINDRKSERIKGMGCKWRQDCQPAGIGDTESCRQINRVGVDKY
jgi:hypothetical protein